MTDKLKPCPFCGSKYISIILPVETEYQVQCGNCYASSSIESTAKKAIKAWNHRTPSDHIVATNKTDDNPPLTLEELREMDGEPVWIEDWWQDFHGWELSADAEDYCAERDTKQYGTSWLAYRRKPEKG